MANLNHIDISKKILEKYKNKDTCFNQYQILIFLERKGIQITYQSLSMILQFLIQKGFLFQIKMKDEIQRDYYKYFKVHNKVFTYENYIDTKTFAENTHYSKETIIFSIKNEKIKDFIKIARKFYININEMKKLKGVYDGI